MKLELLYFDDCPNWEIAAARLDEVAGGRGLRAERRLVTTPEEAEAARFRGSPTILIDGHDPFASEDEPFGLACRVYQTPDGPAGAPTTAQLEAVLGSSTAAGTATTAPATRPTDPPVPRGHSDDQHL